jgi:hypothetical protein
VIGECLLPPPPVRHAPSKRASGSPSLPRSRACTPLIRLETAHTVDRSAAVAKRRHRRARRRRRPRLVQAAKGTALFPATLDTMVSPTEAQRSRVQRSARQLQWPQGAAAATAPALAHSSHIRTPAAPLLQNKLFGGLGLVSSAPCTVQLELRGGQQTVSLKNRRDETESMPLFSSKDTVSGEVRGAAGLPGSRCVYWHTQSANGERRQ